MSVKEAEQLVVAWHKKALDLAFVSVSEIVHLKGKKAEYSRANVMSDSYSWEKFTAQARNNCGVKTIPSIEFFSYVCDPGEGSESLAIGLSTTDGKKWYWATFCKTHYAYEVGLEHFLRTHLLCLSLLETIGDDVHLNVGDEGDFWESRSVEKLIENIKDNNNLLYDIQLILQNLNVPFTRGIYK